MRATLTLPPSIAVSVYAGQAPALGSVAQSLVGGATSFTLRNALGQPALKLAAAPQLRLNGTLLGPTPSFPRVSVPREPFSPTGTSGLLTFGGVEVQASPGPSVNQLLRTNDITRTLTNFHLNSEDLTAWGAGSGTTTATAGTLTDTDVSTVSSRVQVSPLRSIDFRDLYLWSGRVTKGTGICALYLTLTGSTPVSWKIAIDKASGLWSPVDAFSKDSQVCIVDGGAYWDVSVILPNNGSGNTSHSTTLFPAFAASLVLPNQTSDGAQTGPTDLTKVQLEGLPPAPFFVVCEGDSITSGATYPTWPNALGLASGFDLVNTAVSGDSLPAMRTRFDGYKGNGYTHFMLLGGVNDLAADRALSSIQADLTYLWSTAAALGMTVVAMTVTPWSGSANWNASRQTATETLNTWIRAQALASGYALVDGYTLLGDGAGALLAAYDSGDHIHPNAAGRQLIGRAVRTALGWPVPHSAYVGPVAGTAVTSSLVTPVVTRLHPLSRANQVVNAAFAGGGFAPTSWTALVGTGTSAPVTSLLGPDAVAYAQGSNGTTRPAFYQSFTLDPNTTYLFSVQIEAVSAYQTAGNVLGAGSYPAGATVTYPACTGNPAGGTNGYVAPGDLQIQIVTAAAGGSILLRLGLGAINPQAGTMQFSRPRMRPDKSRGGFLTGTITDFALSGNAVTLGQAASGTYAWSGSGNGGSSAIPGATYTPSTALVALSTPYVSGDLVWEP